MTAAIALAADLEAAGVEVAALIDSRADRPARLAGQGAGHRAAVRDRDATAAKRCPSVLRFAGWPIGDARRRRARHVGRLQPVIHLACHRGGKAGLVGGTCRFPGARGRERLGRSPAPQPAICRPGGLPCRMARAKAAAIAADLGRKWPAASFGAVEGDIAAPPARRSGRSPGAKGKAFVDFQNDVHAEGSGPRRAAKASAMSSLPSAIRPTAWRRTRASSRNVNAIGILAEAARGLARRGRHHDFPAVLYAGLLRRADRRHRPAATSSPYASRRCMAGPRSMARSSSRPGSGIAPSWFPAAGREDLARERRPRSAECARKRRPLRCLDARQDRDLRRRMRRSSSTGSTATPS